MRCRSPMATVDGVSGSILAPDDVARGHSSSRQVTGDFALRAQAVIVAAGGIGGKPRSGPAELAATARRAAQAHDLRRARTCRRPHDRDHRGRRRPADQPRPDVALRRRHQELESDLAAPRHPHPARAVVDVVRRHRHPSALAAVPRLRHPRPAAIHHGHRLRLFLVRADPEHHQEGVCAFRLRAESGPHRQELVDDGQARHQQGARRRRWKRSRPRASISSCATTLAISSAP